MQRVQCRWPKRYEHGTDRFRATAQKKGDARQSDRFPGAYKPWAAMAVRDRRIRLASMHRGRGVSCGDEVEKTRHETLQLESKHASTFI
jgi:hypothetical protein